MLQNCFEYEQTLHLVELLIQVHSRSESLVSSCRIVTIKKTDDDFIYFRQEQYMVAKITKISVWGTDNNISVAACKTHGLRKVWTERYSEYSPNSGHELVIYVL